MKQISVLKAISDRLSTFATQKKIVMEDSRISNIVASVCTAGPSYYYIINFNDFSLEYISGSVRSVLGVNPENITFQDLAARIHPDDIHFVVRAEDIAIDTFRHCLKAEKAFEYKMSFCFRMRGRNDNYRMILHQAIILETDKEGKFTKALNIHTDISHLMKINNDKMYLTNIINTIDFYEIDIHPHILKEHKTTVYSQRELEIIRLISKGYHNQQIAELLFISLNTVKNHRKNIMQKSGVGSSSELISQCITAGLI